MSCTWHVVPCANMCSPALNVTVVHAASITPTTHRWHLGCAVSGRKRTKNVHMQKLGLAFSAATVTSAAAAMAPHKASPPLPPPAQLASRSRRRNRRRKKLQSAGVSRHPAELHDSLVGQVVTWGFVASPDDWFLLADPEFSSGAPQEQLCDYLRRFCWPAPCPQQ